MNPGDVVRLLGILGANKIEQRGAKIRSSCPLAKWEHAGGSDSSPSFAVYRTASGLLRGKCLSCGNGGDLRWWYWQVARKSGDWMPEANELVYEHLGDLKAPDVSRLTYRTGGPIAGDADIEPRDPDTKRMPSGKTELLWEDMAQDGSTHAHNLPSKETLGAWQRMPVPDYVKTRGFEEKTYRAWELGYDQSKRRWIFPCWDRHKELVGYTGRICWDKHHCYRCGKSIIDEERTKKKGKTTLLSRCTCGTVYVKYWHITGPWRRNSLYGIHMHDGGPVVVVEGSTDALRLWQLGVRSPLGIFGASPSPKQVAMIGELDVPVYLMGDGDKAGRKMHVDFAGMALNYGYKAAEIHLPDKVDPGDLTLSMAKDLLPAGLFDCAV